MFKYSQTTWWNIGIIVEIHSFCTIVYFFSKKKKKKNRGFLVFLHILPHLQTLCRNWISIFFCHFLFVFRYFYPLRVFVYKNVTNALDISRPRQSKELPLGG